MSMLIRAIASVAIFVTLLTGCAERPPQSADAKAVKEFKPSKRAPRAPAVIKEPINPELRGTARVVLMEAFESNDPVFRANAIEAMQRTLGQDAKDPIIRALSDSDALVRFSGAMAAGQVRLKPAYEKLVGMIEDQDPNVCVAVRFALHRLGDTRFSHDLERTARDYNKTVRANTAMALGLLGEKSALNILRVMTGDTEPGVRIQVAEAMWRLGDEEGLNTLVAGTVIPYGDDQIVSVLALAGPKDKRIAEHVRGKLTSEWTEVSLAAARAMGELQSDEGYTIAMNNTTSTDPRQRALAAFALGAIGRSDAQPALSRLIKDDDPNVKLAAATAVLQLRAPA